jgi:hypothetical protein
MSGLVAVLLQCLEKRGGGVRLPGGEQKLASVCGEYRRRLSRLRRLQWPTVSGEV